MFDKQLENEQKEIDKALLKQILRSPWVIAGIIMFLLAIASPIIAFELLRNSMLNVSKEELESLAYLGDFLTGTTFLLGFSSILFVIASIFIQQRELQVNTKVLDESKTEYEKSNTLMESQLNNSKLQHDAIIKSTDKQIFETSFYNMLNLLRDERKKEYENISYESPIRIDDVVSEIMNNVFSYQFYIDNSVFYDYISQSADHNSATNEIVEVLKFLNNYIDLGFAKTQIIDFYQVSENSTLSSDYGVDIETIIEKLKSEDFTKLKFGNYLLQNKSQIITKTFKYNLDSNFYMSRREIDEYLKLIDIILETISKVEEDRGFYFQIFKSQVSYYEEDFIRHLAYYELRQTWRESIEQIDEEFMRLDRGI